MSVNHNIRFARGRQKLELGVLQMQILWLLNKKPVHGYELMHKLSEIKNARITQGTLYPALERLEEMRLISGKRSKERADRGKIVYSLTESGLREMGRNCKEFCLIFSGVFNDFYCRQHLCKRGGVK